MSESVLENAMTVDVEDYFHVSAFEGLFPRRDWDGLDSRVFSNTQRLLELFESCNIRATFFVLGWVADRFPALVRRIANGGHEVASHGFGHRLVYDQEPEAFREDVRRAKSVLELITGAPVRGFRAPSYSVTALSLWALDVLIEEGYTYDSSIFPIRHDRYGIPLSPRHAFVVRRNCGSLIEVPGSTVRFVGVNFPIGGGGYFRLMPYAWTRWGIRRLNHHESRPAIFYLHPWEIDPEQPRLHASLLSRVRHYRNLDQTESRLRQLIKEFRFAPLGTLVDRMIRADVPGETPLPALPYVW